MFQFSDNYGKLFNFMFPQNDIDLAYSHVKGNRVSFVYIKLQLDYVSLKSCLAKAEFDLRM